MSLIQEIDFGTPIRVAEKTVSLTIDGEQVRVPEGTSVMAAAMSRGVKVPKLCASDNLEAFGSCRLCLVEIEGRRGTPASCTTPAEEGMVVRTQSERLAKLRRGVMELYISDHPLDCLTCSANGNCELQDAAGEVGLREVRYGYQGENHLDDAKDESNPYFSYDPSKCIVCSRCVRACEEVQGTFALTIEGRGFNSRVKPGPTNFIESECVSCGACVQACPTATLIEKSVVERGQPEHSLVTTCAYCGVGCSFKAEMRGEELIRMVPYKAGQANEGHSCVKGRFAYGYATHKDRMLKPMIRAKITDPWREVSWDEAIAYAASELKRIQAKHGREVDRRHQLLTLHQRGSLCRAEIGARCLPQQQYRHLRPRLPFADRLRPVRHARHLGRHAGFQVDRHHRRHPDHRLQSDRRPSGRRFADEEKAARGAKLIVADPRAIDMVRSTHIKADYHLQLRPGTNVALVNSLAHVVVTEGLVNEAYVRERCDVAAFESWARFIALEQNSPEQMEHYTGVPAADVRAAARLYASVRTRRSSTGSA